MNAVQVKEIKLFASPVELRRLADKTEEVWAKGIKCGDSTFVANMVTCEKEGPVVNLYLDQDFFTDRDHKMRDA